MFSEKEPTSAVSLVVDGVREGSVWGGFVVWISHKILLRVSSKRPVRNGSTLANVAGFSYYEPQQVVKPLSQ